MYTMRKYVYFVLKFMFKENHRIQVYKINKYRIMVRVITCIMSEVLSLCGDFKESTSYLWVFRNVEETLRSLLTT